MRPTNHSSGLTTAGHEPSVYAQISSGPVWWPDIRRIGCRSAVFDDSIDLALGPETLRVALTEDVGGRSSMLNCGIACQWQPAFVVALIATSICFQILVSRRLSRLNQAIRRASSSASESRRQRAGQISELVVEYNHGKIETQLEMHCVSY